jgi:hypothetical protein
VTRVACAAAIAAALLLPAAAGAVAVAAPSSVSATVTLNGFDQQATFPATLTVTGGGKTTGWNITAWAPKPASGSNTLSAVYVASQPSAAPCTGNKCVDPTPTGLSWPITLGTSSGGAVKIYNAGLNTGTGSDPVSVPFTADVSANTLTGSYTTTITVAVVSGP